MDIFLFLLTAHLSFYKARGKFAAGKCFFREPLPSASSTGIAVLVRPIWPLTILYCCCLFLLLRPPNGKESSLLLLVNLACAITPLALWRERNQREAHFDGISDISGHTVWVYLAARVRAEVTGLNRYEVSRQWQRRTKGTIGLYRCRVKKPITEAWRRSAAIFREHPLVTVYSFGRSAFEHFIHPSPDVVRAVKPEFFRRYCGAGDPLGGAAIVLGLCSVASHFQSRLGGWIYRLAVSVGNVSRLWRSHT